MSGFDHVLSSDFLQLLHRPAAEASSNLYIVLLNWKLPKSTLALWRHATLRVCADGGANQLYDRLPHWCPEELPAALRQLHLPDLVVGDLDSIRGDVRGFYARHGVQLLDLSGDQDSTDLTKCVRRLREHIAAHGQQDDHQIVALGALGGRLDHTLSNLNSLYEFGELRVALWGEGNLVRLLQPGRTRIVPAVADGMEGPGCGLVPLGGPATVTTRGLQWDVSRCCMQVGGLISTSNKVVAAEVEVTTDAPLLWMTQVSDALGTAPLPAAPTTPTVQAVPNRAVPH